MRFFDVAGTPVLHNSKLACKFCALTTNQGSRRRSRTVRFNIFAALMPAPSVCRHARIPKTIDAAT